MSIELTGGRWVQDGLIRRWTGPRPVDIIFGQSGDAGDCRSCSRKLVFCREWAELDPAKRKAMRDTHAEKGGADGICKRCLARQKRLREAAKTYEQAS